MAKNTYEKVKGFNPLTKKKTVTTKIETTGPVTKWKQALTKVKAVNGLRKKPGTATALDKKVEVAIGKIQSGIPLKSLNDANPKFEKVITNLRASGQFKNVDESQVVKVTGDVITEVTKKKTPWSFIKDALMISSGLVFYAAVASMMIGIVAMLFFMPFMAS
ncbi:RxLR effector protein [Phytophthora megakarya]|uniref:RxLR effector protein n=1 Tax=Phytophthora megakarya TaxID=4795 RepID=A0A225V679_9STRA|nr:RxLR effector protein [Phytophthora megakarya]